MRNGTRAWRSSCWGLVLACSCAAVAVGQDFEQEPIAYGKREPRNCVSQLAVQLQDGRTTLTHSSQFGYLPSLLAALEVPTSSQLLVFSKTSLQRYKISPRTPRALYFNDDTYVGYCHEGDVLEISTVDDDLGAVFYTLAQESATSPQLIRQSDNCLICHASSATKQVPGHTVRSVYADASGLPILASGTYRTNHTSPFAQRWGGWYVSGTHGAQRHLGNFIYREHGNPERADNSAGQNVTDLADFFDVQRYLTPHSDLVALMVLEHQAEAHNCMTQANFGTRQALHYEQTLNRGLNEPLDKRWQSTTSRIQSACEPLVECLLFCEETVLTDPLRGTSSYAAEFVRRGLPDKQGRSLREFDLSRRMFRYPCSYLIYSTSFRALPPEAKEYVLRRLWTILDGKDESKKFAHLSDADRRAILEILTDTLPEFRAVSASKT